MTLKASLDYIAVFGSDVVIEFQILPHNNTYFLRFRGPDKKRATYFHGYEHVYLTRLNGLTKKLLATRMIDLEEQEYGITQLISQILRDIDNCFDYDSPEKSALRNFNDFVQSSHCLLAHTALYIY